MQVFMALHLSNNTISTQTFMMYVEKLLNNFSIIYYSLWFISYRRTWEPGGCRTTNLCCWFPNFYIVQCYSSSAYVLIEYMDNIRIWSQLQKQLPTEAPTAKLVEHWTRNLKGLGSNPMLCFVKLLYFQFSFFSSTITWQN